MSAGNDSAIRVRRRTASSCSRQENQESSDREKEEELRERVIYVKPGPGLPVAGQPLFWEEKKGGEDFFSSQKRGASFFLP